jgi:VWFA-related protein
MRLPSIPSILIVLLTVSAASSLCADPPQSHPSNSSPVAAPSTSSQLNQIVVDVVVTDDHDQPVVGLRQQDFQIVEDDKLQQIRAFGFHAEQPGMVILDAASLPENTFSNARTSDTGTVNVILLDELNTAIQDQEAARRELTEYFSRKSPESRFAVFVLRKGDTACASCDSLRMLQGVTADKDLLVGAVKSQGAKPQPKVLRLAVSGFEDTTMQSLGEIGNFLEEMPGRKNLIWLAGNFDAAPVAIGSDIWFPPKFKDWQSADPLSPTLMLHLASGRLSGARVAVYPIDLTGSNRKIVAERVCQQPRSFWLGAPEDPEFQVCNESGIKLDSMALQSGGRAFHDPTHIQESIAQAVADGADYYTLAYSPTDTKLNGKLRSIKVVVDGKNYHALWRQKYFADDPATLFRTGTEASPDIVLPVRTGTVPWSVVRVSSLNHPLEDKSEEPILAAMKCGAPESRDIVFAAHVTPTTKPVKATPEQMEQLQDFESFRAERVEQAMLHLSKEEQKSQHNGRTVINTLPPPEPVFVQGYDIDYSIVPTQLTLTVLADGTQSASLEIAFLAYDDRGQKLAGIKEAIHITLNAEELQQFRGSLYKTHQAIIVPERMARLRLAVRDISQNKTGSLEIPEWSISSPFRRRRLEIPED